MKLVNGQFLGAKRTHVSAPSPAEIAERAYDRAIAVAEKHIASHPCTSSIHEQIRGAMESARPAELAALRDEVLNPAAIRSKR